MSGAHQQGLYVDGRSGLHTADPATKLVGLLAFVVSVATLKPDADAAFVAGSLLVIAALFLAKLTTGQMLRRMIPALPVVVAASLIPLISSDPAAGEASRALLAKIVIGAGASVLFAATTRPTEIVVALQRLRLPRVIVGIVSFMFRYLDLMISEIARLRVALTSRGYQPSWLGQAKPIASAGGAMFARSFERGERVHSAMVARGFNGALPIGVAPSTPSWVWAVALTPAALVLLARQVL